MTYEMTSTEDAPVIETSVMVKTPDGSSDAYFIHPPTGSYPGVLIWTDGLGLRPSMRDIGKRIAADGTRCWCRTRTTAAQRRR
jgi:dienelactone hydrolase